MSKINVIITKKKNIQVSTNSFPSFNSNQIILKNNPTLTSIGDATVEDLNDVDTTNLSDKNTLIYDQQRQKWVAQTLHYEDITGDFDAGTF